jgi:Txe/YoeB family toxin of Txe-Axe toxin-antitoxin module
MKECNTSALKKIDSLLENITNSPYKGIGRPEKINV